MAEKYSLLVVAVLSTFLSAVQGSMCYVANSYYKECDYGCCGSLPYEECCDNTVGLIVGLVVAGFVVVVVVVVVVCIYVQHKSNQVVRIVESAHSTRNNANITILHMGSDNPYQQQAPQHVYVNPTMMSHPGNPASAHEPPTDPFGMPANNYPMKPQPRITTAKPRRPPLGNPSFPPAAGPNLDRDVDMTSSTVREDDAGMTSFGDSQPMTSSNGGFMLTSTSMGTRKVPPLPSIPAAGVSSPEPPTPRFNVFGAPKGTQKKEPLSGLPPIKNGSSVRNGGGNDWGLEDMEDLD